MFSRKLRVIGYDKSHVDYDDDSDFIRLLCFVEERFLHKRSKQWIVDILYEKDKEIWNRELDNYLGSCNIRSTHETFRRTICDQLLTAAIGVLYDTKANLHDLSASKFTSLRDAKLRSSTKAQNPLNILDYSSPVTQCHIKELCKTIGIADHPNPVSVPRVCADEETLLKAACIFIEENLSSEHIQARNEEQKIGKAVKTFDLNSFPLGMTKQKDHDLDKAARCLRLLTIEDIRETQTKVNETLAAIQELTVNTPERKAV